MTSDSSDLHFCPPTAPEQTGSDQPAAGITSTFAPCIQALGLQSIQRHLFLCADQTAAKCCRHETGLETWNYLKQRLKDLSLDKPSEQVPFCIFRTKANCLRVCQNGPILLVYPDGVWYYGVTPTVMERILQEHILGNQIVTDYLILQQPLPTPINPIRSICEHIESTGTDTEPER